ncbi:sigma-E factor negative regulatory protein [Tepidicella baoligensis]|uniref:sigma-E factor negative regulatory protein n=1 Tax=Tepidicella baoligensis TaxID=2707016 RepID=UPI001C5CA8A3|nr:sigma-E factor negative regulatory protein [Tepidicella baoligensis]
MQTTHTPTASAAAQGSFRSSVVDEGVSLPERLSALVDGECGLDTARMVASAMAGSAELHQAWTGFHCVGQALRGEPEMPADPAFVAGVMARIAREEVQPRGAAERRLPAAAAATEAANDAVFRWKMVAGVASLVAVAAVAWQIVATPLSAAGPQLAQAPAAGQAPLQAVITPQGVMLRDPQLEEFLAAHRQLGGMSALQMPAGFLRNATYEAPQR